MSVALSLSPRNLYGLLTALGNRLFGEGESLSNEELRGELSLTSTAEIICVEQLLKEAAMKNMSEDNLIADIMEGSKDFSFTTDQLTVLAKWWKDNKEKTGEVLLRRSTFNRSYKNLNWRVQQTRICS